MPHVYRPTYLAAIRICRPVTTCKNGTCVLVCFRLCTCTGINVFDRVWALARVYVLQYGSHAHRSLTANQWPFCFKFLITMLCMLKKTAIICASRFQSQPIWYGNIQKKLNAIVVMSSRLYLLTLLSEDYFVC